MMTFENLSPAQLKKWGLLSAGGLALLVLIVFIAGKNRKPSKLIDSGDVSLSDISYNEGQSAPYNPKDPEENFFEGLNKTSPDSAPFDERNRDPNLLANQNSPETSPLPPTPDGWNPNELTPDPNRTPSLPQRRHSAEDTRTSPSHDPRPPRNHSGLAQAPSSGSEHTASLDKTNMNSAVRPPSSPTLPPTTSPETQPLPSLPSVPLPNEHAQSPANSPSSDQARPAPSEPVDSARSPDSIAQTPNSIPKPNQPNTITPPSLPTTPSHASSLPNLKHNPTPPERIPPTSPPPKPTVVPEMVKIENQPPDSLLIGRSRYYISVSELNHFLAANKEPLLLESEDSNIAQVSFDLAITFSAWLTADHRAAALIGNDVHYRLPRLQESPARNIWLQDTPEEELSISPRALGIVLAKGAKP